MRVQDPVSLAIPGLRHFNLHRIAGPVLLGEHAGSTNQDNRRFLRPECYRAIHSAFAGGVTAVAKTYPVQESAVQRSLGAELEPASAKRRPQRLVSLDAFRGFVMFVLAANGFGIAHFAALPPEAPIWQEQDRDTWQQIAWHFNHATWVTVDRSMGVSGWDLIQPAFMFMVGVAMPFSYLRRAAFGHSALRRMLHAVFRALLLVLLGVFLYSLSHQRTNWIFTNVLAQIGLGYVFVYLLLNRRRRIQIGAVAVILVGFWGLFFAFPPLEGTDFAAVNASEEEGEVFTGKFAAWSKNGNVAFRFDQWLLPQLRTPPAIEEPRSTTDSSSPIDHPPSDSEYSPDSSTQAGTLPQNSEDGESADELRVDEGEGEAAIVDADRPGLIRQCFFSNPEPYAFNRGGYTTLNFVPSMATILLGVLCGQLLLSSMGFPRKLFTLIAAGAVCVGLGLAVHLYVCPIVKRIWTPSWTLFSGGCVIWLLALFYLMFDGLPFRRLAYPLQVIGMNSLAMYLMGQMLFNWTSDEVIGIHLSGFLESVVGVEMLRDDMWGRIIGPSCVAIVFWLLAVWMHRRQIYVRV